MKIQMIVINILFALVSLSNYNSGNAVPCAFNLAPNELIILEGNQLKTKTLSCDVKSNGEDEYHLLNFISETNTSLVNNLALPEGTVMSLFFTSLEHDKLTLKFTNNSRLCISNDTTEVIN